MQSHDVIVNLHSSCENSHGWHTAMSGRGYLNRSRQRGRTLTGVGREVVPWLESGERSVPLAERSVPLAEKSVPLAEKSAPLAEKSVPLAEKSVPLAERLVSTADEKSEWGDKPTTPSLFNCSRQYTHTFPFHGHSHYGSMSCRLNRQFKWCLSLAEQGWPHSLTRVHPTSVVLFERVNLDWTGVHPTSVVLWTR